MPDGPVQGSESEISRAPWTVEQVGRIVAWQRRGDVHELTCEHHSTVPLRVDLRWLYCTHCRYRQTWIHAGIAGPR